LNGSKSGISSGAAACQIYAKSYARGSLIGSVEVMKGISSGAAACQIYAKSYARGSLIGSVEVMKGICF
jgi:hypothetical protein